MDCWREGKDGMQNLINGLCSSCGGILGCRYDHSKKVPSLIHFPLDVAVNRLEVKTCWSRIWMLLVLKPPVCISGQFLQWYNLIWYMISWMAGHLIWLCHLDWVGYRFHCYIHLGLTLVVSAPRTPQLFLWSFKLLALVQLPHFLSSPKLLLFLPKRCFHSSETVTQFLEPSSPSPCYSSLCGAFPERTVIRYTYLAYQLMACSKPWLSCLSSSSSASSMHHLGLTKIHVHI